MKRTNIYLPIVICTNIIILYTIILYLMFTYLGIMSIIFMSITISPIMYLTNLLYIQKSNQMKYLPTKHQLYTYTLTSEDDVQVLKIYRVNIFRYSLLDTVRKKTWTTKDLVSNLEQIAKKVDTEYEEKYKKELNFKYLKEEMSTWGINKIDK